MAFTEEIASFVQSLVTICTIKDSGPDTASTTACLPDQFQAMFVGCVLLLARQMAKARAGGALSRAGTQSQPDGAALPGDL